MPIAAVIAAAGRSTRMGEPKQLLPWRDATPTGSVLGTVLINLAAAGVQPVICVVGHARDEIGAVAGAAGAEVVYNPDYATVEMLASYQTGVRHLLAHHAQTTGALFAVGDQPHIPVRVTRQVIHHALCRPRAIVVPSYAMRRGHPMYIPRDVWDFLLQLGPEESMRAVMRHFADRVEYVTVGVEAILLDMDTPEDYAALRAG
ncbi:MAG: nucleotidyltransferase family protein [Litorilinea sp.]